MHVILLVASIPSSPRFFREALGFFFGAIIPCHGIVIFIPDNISQVIERQKATVAIVDTRSIGKIFSNLLVVHDAEHGIDESITHGLIHHVTHLAKSFDIDVVGTKGEVVDVVLHDIVGLNGLSKEKVAGASLCGPATTVHLITTSFPNSIATSVYIRLFDLSTTVDANDTRSGLRYPTSISIERTQPNGYLYSLGRVSTFLSLEG